MSNVKKLSVSPGPHISTSYSTQAVMRDVIIGLAPAALAGIYYFKAKAAILIAVCVLTCMITEWLCCKIRKKQSSIGDLSAVVTGLILAMSLPPALPVIYAIIGCVFTITITKMVFGGLGYNPFNPAMAGRVFLTACFGMAMTTWTLPSNLNSDMPDIGSENAVITSTFQADETTTDAITGATPLGWVKKAIKTRNLEDATKIVKANYANSQLKASFYGYTGGCLGETSSLALLLGGIYMLIRRTITWVTPVCVLASAFVFAEIVFLFDRTAFANPLLHIFSGGMLICAFFIATDPVTIPISRKGMAIFGIGTGLLIMLIRTFGGYPEGVMYAILIMNAFTPLIDKACKIKPIGGVPGGK
ncbi:MAG: RnfABCDGE type electron transport complex subunit D [Sedimentisphaeraceae bacterium JB056]